MLAVTMDIPEDIQVGLTHFTLQNCHINIATIAKYTLLPPPTLLYHLLSSIYSLTQQISIDSPVNQMPASQMPSKQGLERSQKIEANLGVL